VWHVLEVYQNSPASAAGFIPHKGTIRNFYAICLGRRLCADWIIGCPDITISSQDDFYNLMIHNTSKPVRLIVFNSDADACREVVVTPSFDWGGDGWYISLLYLNIPQINILALAVMWVVACFIEYLLTLSNKVISVYVLFHNHNGQHIS